MTFAVAYGVTALIFFVLDFVGLTKLLKPLFEGHIGEMMLDEPRLGAAAVFYLFYVFGVVWFVILPALAGGHSVWWVLAHGALLGALAYGTYEFTNMATLKGWSWTMVIVDVSWGLALTAVSAAGGFLAARALTG